MNFSFLKVCVVAILLALVSIAKASDKVDKMTVEFNLDSTSCSNAAQSMKQNLQSYGQSQTPPFNLFSVQYEDKANCRWVDTNHGSHEVCFGYICTISLSSSDPLYTFGSQFSEKYAGPNHQAQCEAALEIVKSKRETVSALIRSDDDLLSEGPCRVDSILIQKN